ncbi:hypothetical protein [Gordonia sp. (in: high G+C Gram-positive bacteria)]
MTMNKIDDQPLGECPCCGDLYDVTDHFDGRGRHYRRTLTCPHEGEPS